jgi:hypothetical protein
MSTVTALVIDSGIPSEPVSVCGKSCQGPSIGSTHRARQAGGSQGSPK